ncbi:MAG TPA: OmpH family outer membrane protein [Ramlibacter sp.]|nr:OmpH family outer membrane protein [Ramlibacter sp.]
MHFQNIRAIAGAAALTAALLPFQAGAQQKPAAQPAPAAPAAAAAPQQPAAKPGEPLKSPVVAVVDVQRIMQESSASKGIQKAIESQRDSYQKEIQTLEDKLQNAENELRKQQTVLAPDAFATKRRDFEKQVADVQRTVQERKRTLDTAFNDAMTHVQKTMLDIVQDIADERGANVVIPRNLLVLFASSLDVTESVLDRLNKQLPTVAVTIPKK